VSGYDLNFLIDPETLLPQPPFQCCEAVRNLVVIHRHADGAFTAGQHT
jgi:hypothetical protein